MAIHTMNENGIILFVKYPDPGRVKTRLSVQIGRVCAAELYRAFVSDIIESMTAVSAIPFVYADVSHDLNLFKLWLGEQFAFYPQRGADLGIKMKNAFREQFENGFEKLLLIGSDIPSVTPHLFEEAFEHLDRNDCVLGPAVDGGYYLIGFRRDSFGPAVFDDIAWSTSDVFLETVECLDKSELRYKSLPRLCDIDRFEDLCDYYFNNRNAANRTIEYIENNLTQHFTDLLEHEV